MANLHVTMQNILATAGNYMAPKHDRTFSVKKQSHTRHATTLVSKKGCRDIKPWTASCTAANSNYSSCRVVGGEGAWLRSGILEAQAEESWNGAVHIRHMRWMPVTFAHFLWKLWSTLDLALLLLAWQHRMGARCPTQQLSANQTIKAYQLINRGWSVSHVCVCAYRVPCLAVGRSSNSS